MRSRFTINQRAAILFILLVIVLIVFLIELAVLAPEFFARPPNDYDIYAHWGLAERLGPEKYSYWLVNYYPLPTTLWVFVPLSLLPNWFAIIWTIAPFLFALWLFRKPGVILWLYYPLLVQTGIGQLDGWLLLPLYWLIEDRPWLAGVGAVLVLFKPQLAFVTVAYALLSWVIRRDWRNLRAFAITLAIIYLPAFIVNPLWLLTMLDRMHVRANESLLPTRGASLWAWIWRGGITLWFLPIVGLLATVLVLYIFVRRGKRMQAAQLLGLLVTPVLYAANFVTIIPILKTPRQILILTIISWVGVVMDTLAGGWGGAYAIIPITALFLLARENDATITPPTPTA